MQRTETQLSSRRQHVNRAERRREVSLPRRYECEICPAPTLDGDEFTDTAIGRAHTRCAAAYEQYKRIATDTELCAPLDLIRVLNTYRRVTGHALGDDDARMWLDDPAIQTLAALPAGRLIGHGFAAFTHNRNSQLRLQDWVRSATKRWPAANRWRR